MFSHGKFMKHVNFLSWMKSCAQLMKKWVGDQQLWYMKSTWRSLVSHPETCSVFVLINISCQSNDFYNEHYSCWIHEEARRKSTTFEHGKLTATQGKHLSHWNFKESAHLWLFSNISLRTKIFIMNVILVGFMKKSEGHQSP